MYAKRYLKENDFLFKDSKYYIYNYGGDLKDSSILIFDEATSMLDNETEDNIISQLLSVFKNKTIILIAHRLSTVKNADIIYVLKDGQVIEKGNHECLLEKEGFYYNLCNI